jgi:hypothetical protein
MDLLFKSNSEEKKKEIDPSIKIGKYILPLLVYIPITIFLIIIGSFFGVKIYKFIAQGGGIAKFFERSIYKIFSFKDNLNMFIQKTVDKFWPDKNSLIDGGKSYKHVRLDSALIFSGSLFILVMIVIYNYDYIKSLMFSNVNKAIYENKNKFRMNKDKVIQYGAVMVVGSDKKEEGTIQKIYKHEDGSGEDYYYDVNTKDYVEYTKDIDEKQNKLYKFYDVNVGGKVYKISNNIIDSVYNSTGKSAYNSTEKSVNVGDVVYLKSQKNIYDHNLFNVYDTNASTDFRKNSLKFVNKKDHTKNVDNWEAHLNIPKKENVIIMKWGEDDIKKGVFSLSTDKNHSGFSLGLKGNGAYVDDPLNNYIFKDKNGKTYQANLEQYGVNKIGTTIYEPGFKIVYKIKKNPENGHDVTIFINNNYVMKIKNGGVPLNEIKWCGPPTNNIRVSPGENISNASEEESMQYFVKEEIICDPDKEVSRTINGVSYCVKSCGNNTYFDLFSKDCKQCPENTEIDTSSKSKYPLLDACLYPKCENEDEYYDVPAGSCKKIEDKKNEDEEKLQQDISKGFGQNVNISTRDEFLKSFPLLESKINENKNNIFDENGHIIDSINSLSSELRNNILHMGGLPISDDGKVIINNRHTPTLFVYQNEIIKKMGKDGSNPDYPLQKDESGLFDRFFNSVAPFTWFKIKRNVKNNTPNMNTRGVAKRNSTMIGGVALLFGFVIFMSLLVNQYNKEVLAAEPEKLKDVFIDKTSHYMYSVVFIGLALGLFTLLLFYAATSEAGSKFLSILIIGLSAIIFLAGLAVLFRKKLEAFTKNNIYFKFIYYTIFIIPCLFIDIVNYIYYEFKSSPKIVFTMFALEIAFILSVLILPEFRNRLYLYISPDKNKKKNINIKIHNLKLQIAKLENSIEKIKKFNPAKDPLVRMDLNSLNHVEMKTLKKNDKDEYVEEVTPQNTDPFGIVYRFFVNQKDKIKNIANKFNPLDYNPLSPGLDENTWDFINKQQLHKRTIVKINELKKLLYGFGYGTPEECDKLDSSKRRKCYLIMTKMIKHIQINAPNIIIFTTRIDEINSEIARLKTVKSNSSNIYDKGVVALNKPVYFRHRKFLPIKDFNKTQLEELKHNYSLSSWFYVHSQPPNFSNKYNKETEILSYNGSPTIYYFGKKNELIIKTKKISPNANDDTNSMVYIENIKINEDKLAEETKKLKKAQQDLKNITENSQSIKNIQILSTSKDKIETYKKNVENLEKKIKDINFEILNNKKLLEDDKNDMFLLYTKSKFKLQKWHNLVVNYIGGTVDIFLDGELVASTKRIVSFKSYNQLTVGEPSIGGDGIGGGICNIVYYPSYISKSRIQSNYNYFKDKNPPTI